MLIFGDLRSAFVTQQLVFIVFLKFLFYQYVYAREGRKLTRNGKEYVTLVMHSVLKDTIPQESGVIRVDDYHQSVVMTKLGPHGSHGETRAKSNLPKLRAISL